MDKLVSLFVIFPKLYCIFVLPKPINVKNISLSQEAPIFGSVDDFWSNYFLLVRKCETPAFCSFEHPDLDPDTTVPSTHGSCCTYNLNFEIIRYTITLFRRGLGAKLRPRCLRNRWKIRQHFSSVSIGRCVGLVVSVLATWSARPGFESRLFGSGPAGPSHRVVWGAQITLWILYK